jgi:L-aminopeptidase/D-esterase-like protein
MMKQIELTDIEGIQVGHAQDLEAATGCTVIISEEGATAGVDVRGGAPGTRETDLLNPVNLVQKVHGVILAGGSAFGLDAAAGVMQYLEERNIGFDVDVARVPIVCGAVLFDLAIGNHRIRPDKDMGYRACLTGGSAWCERAMKSGLGCYSLKAEGLKVGALVAVNCLGDVIDPLTGQRLAGPLNEDMETLADTEELMIKSCADKKSLFCGNTTIGVVVTNAVLTKAQATKVASMAQNGYARTMRPAHSMYDGDTIFAMSTGCVEADVSVVGLLAARVMERAVIAAVKNAKSLCGLKCYSDLRS